MVSNLYPLPVPFCSTYSMKSVVAFRAPIGERNFSVRNLLPATCTTGVIIICSDEKRERLTTEVGKVLWCLLPSPGTHFNDAQDHNLTARKSCSIRLWVVGFRLGGRSYFAGQVARDGLNLWNKSLIWISRHVSPMVASGACCEESGKIFHPDIILRLAHKFWAACFDELIQFSFLSRFLFQKCRSPTARSSISNRSHLADLDEGELFMELIRDVANELDIDVLCHKILVNVSLLTHADRGSLFLVKGPPTGKYLVAKLFDVTQNTREFAILCKKSQFNRMWL